MSERKYDRLEIDGAIYKTHFTEKFANRKKWEPTSPGVVTTRIPGSIIEVHVQEGQEVKKGDLLCLLEAMKMHNKVVAPVAGVVKHVHVAKGDKLHKDAVMFEIE